LTGCLKLSVIERRLVIIFMNRERRV
jgi:hypothetical protein